MPMNETSGINLSSDMPSMNRRRFLGTAAMAGAATFAAPAILRGRGLNEKLNITVIGTGGLSHLMYDLCESIDHHEPDLTLIGLRLVYEKNA